MKGFFLYYRLAYSFLFFFFSHALPSLILLAECLHLFFLLHSICVCFFISGSGCLVHTFKIMVCYTIKSELNMWKILISVAVNEFSVVNYGLWKDLYVSSNCVIPLIRLYFVLAMTNNKSIQFNTTSWVKQPVCGYCSIRSFTLQNRPWSSGSHFSAIL